MGDMLIKNGFLLFWGQWPSNWRSAPMTIDGVKYGCVEQWMMAEKARLFGDKATRKKILATQDPAKQKALGREVQGFDETRWVAKRYPIVLQGVIEKYTQNDDLRALLLDTGELEFVEASPHDRIWGIGLNREDPRAWNRASWRGLNLLGKVHDEARKILRGV